MLPTLQITCHLDEFFNTTRKTVKLNFYDTNGKVSTNFAAAKKGKVGSNFFLQQKAVKLAATVKDGKVGSNFTAAKMVTLAAILPQQKMVKLAAILWQKKRAS